MRAIFCYLETSQPKATTSAKKGNKNHYATGRKANALSSFINLKTGQSYTRIVERSYYGMQAGMQNELGKYDIKKGFECRRI